MVWRVIFGSVRKAISSNYFNECDFAHDEAKTLKRKTPSWLVCISLQMVENLICSRLLGQCPVVMASMGMNIWDEVPLEGKKIIPFYRGALRRWSNSSPRGWCHQFCRQRDKWSTTQSAAHYVCSYQRSANSVDEQNKKKTLSRNCNFPRTVLSISLTSLVPKN